MGEVVSKLLICVSPTLATATRHLCTGIRHMATWHPTRGVHEIVSQRSVASFVFEACETNEDLRNNLCTTSLQDADLPSWDRLHALTERDTAKVAFQIMAAYSITSVPVVDSTSGEALGVASCTDIVFSHHISMDTLVLEFVSTSRESRNAQRQDAVVACSPHHSLWDALQTAIRNEVHHVYVLDSLTRRPRAVVSFSDILRRL